MGWMYTVHERMARVQPGKLSIMHRIGYYMCTDVLDIICKRILNTLHKSGGYFHRTLVCCTCIRQSS
jgi:hypothetical protein